MLLRCLYPFSDNFIFLFMGHLWVTLVYIQDQFAIICVVNRFGILSFEVADTSAKCPGQD